MERLRRHKKQGAVEALPIEDIFAQTVPPPRRPAVQPAAPAASAVPEEEVILDPAQRERVYQAYLQEWQHKTTLEQAQKEQVLHDDAVLFQEDWMAAQECLQTADAHTPAVCTVRLKPNQPPEVLPSGAPDSDALAEWAPTGDTAADGGNEAEPETAPVVHVHLHVLEPQNARGRNVHCVSEAALLQELADKLRPHLADAVAGMVRVAVQKNMAHVINDLHKQLLSEVPEVVDEVLRHNLERALQQVKRGR